LPANILTPNVVAAATKSVSSKPYLYLIKNVQHASKLIGTLMIDLKFFIFYDINLNAGTQFFKTVF
jgi:hypothetical protein